MKSSETDNQGFDDNSVKRHIFSVKEEKGKMVIVDATSYYVAREKACSISDLEVEELEYVGISMD